MSNKKPIKLYGNENCYGFSPLAKQAIEKNAQQVHFYPDVNPVALKEKLAIKYKVAPGNIIVGAGSVRIIDGLIQTVVGLEEEVLTFERSFIAYGQLSGFHKRKCNFAPLTDLRCNPEKLLPLINEKTRLIFIANPNNPTGTIISHAELESFLSKIPKDIVVAIDEAYAEYVTDSTFPNSVELQKKYSNLVILHSFSKIHGLAGLRIGFAIMEISMAAKMSAGQIPFSISRISAEAALASLDDKEFLLMSAKENAKQREYLFTELKKLGYNTIQSQSNFIYVWFDTDEQKIVTYKRLFDNGIMICDMKIFGQEKALRIGVGDKETNIEIAHCLS